MYKKEFLGYIRCYKLLRSELVEDPERAVDVIQELMDTMEKMKIDHHRSFNELINICD